METSQEHPSHVKTQWVHGGYLAAIVYNWEQAFIGPALRIN